MGTSPANTPQMEQLVDRIVASYRDDERTQHLDSAFLPSRGQVIDVIELFRRLIFPGFFDEERLTSQNVYAHVGELLQQLQGLLQEQVRQAIRYEANRVDPKGEVGTCTEWDEQSHAITMAVLERIPLVRRMLALDVKAAFNGDPATIGTDETIFCYPGIDAIFMHRIAHELSELNVPLLPRMMSEYAHNETGIDIHPDAQIGKSFFIDHGTGVVIGQTTIIGDRVQIYQGVTLGALAPSAAETWRGRKRHPTIEDDVTIYGGAIILGGETVIGRGAEIGGTVFLITSVPAFHKVRMKRTEIQIEPSRRLRRRVEGQSGSN